MARACYVAATHEGAEARARMELERQAKMFPDLRPFEVLLPMERYMRAGGEESELCFPGYIFVVFDLLTDEWRSVNGTRGVIKLLPTFRELPMALPDEVWQWLAAARQPVDQRPRAYARGERVRIRDDYDVESLAGMEGVVKEKARKQTVKIWLAALGGRVVHIPLSATRLAECDSARALR